MATRKFSPRQELIEKFNLDSVGRSAGVFDPEKLLWLNAHYIKEAPPARLAWPDLASPYLEANGPGRLPIKDYVSQGRSVTVQAAGQDHSRTGRSRRPST